MVYHGISGFYAGIWSKVVVGILNIVRLNLTFCFAALVGSSFVFSNKQLFLLLGPVPRSFFRGSLGL